MPVGVLHFIAFWGCLSVSVMHRGNHLMRLMMESMLSGVASVRLSKVKDWVELPREGCLPAAAVC